MSVLLEVLVSISSNKHVNEQHKFKFWVSARNQWHHSFVQTSIPGEAEVPCVVSRVRSTNLDGKMAAGNQANRKINTISDP